MNLLIGIAMSTVVILLCVYVIYKSIQNKKIIPLLIVIATVLFYVGCYLYIDFFYLAWTILLIPQILFLLYVFVFMCISLFSRTKKTDISNKKFEFVSIILSVHNEENVIEKTVENLLNINYPKEFYDITFIDDFSTDNTLNILKKFNDRISIVDRSINNDKNTLRGKPAAINEYINKLKGELICILDADSLIEKDFILKLVSNFRNKKIGIVQGRNISYNRNINLISLLTAFDIYSMQHTIYKPLSFLGFGMFEGRAAMFRKDVFKEVGGFDPFLPAEDFDFGYRVGLEGYEIKYEEFVFANEQVTETPLEWYKQRKRWLSSHVLSCFKNLKDLYRTEKISSSKKISASFFISSLLWAFTLNFFGPLLLINEFTFYSKYYPYIFISCFSLTISFFCLSYVLQSKKIQLIIFIPIMLIYYWIFTIIQTYVLFSEKILNIKLSYKKALHRKPFLDEI